MNLPKVLISGIAIAFVLAVAAFGSENPMLIRVEINQQDDITILLRAGFDIPVITENHADVIVYPDEIHKIDESGLTYEIIHEDLTLYYQSRNPLSLDMGGYPTYSEVIDIIDSLHSNYPSIVSARWSVGLSVENRNLWVFKISDNVDTDEDEPEVFYNALTHAREPAGMTWQLHFAGWLCQNYGSDPIATDIINNREIFILPVVNPDGYEYNRITNPSGGGMWRKNRRNNGDGNYGVDIARNWGYQWGYDDNGSSPYTNNETYRGPSAFSEPETEALRQFINSRNFSFSVNAHCYGSILLYSWGYDDIYTPDHDFFMEIGDSASTLIGYAHGTAWELLYNVNGGADDWQYGEQFEKPLIFCMSPETGESYDGFWPEPYRIPQLNQQMLPYGIYVAQLAGNIQGLAFEYPIGIPEITVPNQTTSFQVIVSGVRGGIPVPGSGRLHYSVDEAPFVTVDMPEGPDNHYQAVLPGIICGSLIEFYFTAEEATAGVISDPRGAPDETYGAFPVTDLTAVFDDNFEADLGWAVVNSPELTDGAWDRGVPAGGGDRGDPPTDYDGSGQCYLTDNVYGNSDVDGGYTYLISPTFDLSNLDAIVNYALWYTNYTGDNPNSDLFKVYISNNNGSSWTLAETIGPVTSSGWTEHSFGVNDFVQPNSTVKVRFEASDLSSGSIVEAGIDAFSIVAYECNDITGGTITGTVTDNNGAIDGVLVVADDGTGNSGTDVTSDGGAYTINVPASVYDVGFSHPDYRDTTITQVTVSENDTTTLNVLMEEMPGVVHGVVTDEYSAPVENVYVIAVSTSANDSTDVNGEYMLVNLTPGSYDVSFSHISYVDTVISDISVTPGDTSILNVVMIPTLLGLEYLPGDANMYNGIWPPEVIGSDVTYLVGYFRGLPSNQPCFIDGFWCSADANGDCNIIGSDITRLVSYFRGAVEILYCPDYQPAWLTPDDLPDEPPSGWPNCESPMVNDGKNRSSENTE